MSAESSQPAELLAIAFLVDASLALSYEWKRLFQEYVVQLLQRCNIALGPNKLARMAFITYGTADSIQSPIVKQIYFTELRYIIQDIKDDSRRLGIGQTDSGGGKGMAALEGFAAALDMFDLLRTTWPKDSDCRIIHVAASPPDNSEHPRWNTSTLLDSLTWELLPAELRKRNIQLSGINTSPSLPRFSELYTQTATGNTTSPWFNIRSQHLVFLSGFTATQPQPKPKRLAEPITVERTPETKRQRTTSTQGAADSPSNVLGQTSPSVQATTLTSPTAPAANTAQPPSTLPQPIRFVQQLQLLVTKKKQLEEEFKLFATQKQTALAQGNSDAANHCDREMTKRKDQLLKLNQANFLMQQQQQQALARRRALMAQNTGQHGPDAAVNAPSTPAMARAVTSPGTTSKDAQPPPNPGLTTATGHLSNLQSPVQNPPTTPVRSISTPSVTSVQNAGLNAVNSLASQLMGNTGNRPLPPEAAVQMQKLIESNRIHNNRPLPSGGSIASNANGQAIPGVVPSEGSVNINSGAVINSVGLATQNPDQSAPQPILVWEGILCWNGTGSDGNKKEIRTRVSASSSNANNSHAETWPTSLTLMPAQTPAVSIPEFQDWIRRTRPVLCTFKARTSEDESDYRMLVQVMTTKRMYATSSWTLPSGLQEKNVLIFPINNLGLCGAFFPLTGIPEMPKNTIPQIPPAIMTYILQMPVEQRTPALNHIRQRIAAGGESAANIMKALAQRYHQQLQQNAQSRTINNQFGLNAGLTQMAGAMSNNANLMNMMGMNTVNTGVNSIGAMGSMGNPSAMLPNMARPNPPGGSGASMGLNYDVLQSFMRRNNPDGNNASGMGPS